MSFPRGFSPAARVAAVSLGLFAATGAASFAGGESTRQVVGRIADEPVYAAEVLLHLRPAPPRVGTDPVPDPREAAFDAAVRIRLLAQEARRRGISAPDAAPEIVEAHLVREVIRDELEARLGGGVPDEASLRAFYQENQLRLRSLESARVAAVVVEDGEEAERLLGQAAQADDATFGKLVAEHSLDGPSREQGGFLAEIDRHGKGLETALARVAVGLRHDGAVGLAQGPAGRYFVLRATKVSLEPPTWDEETVHRVRNLLLHQQRDEVVDALVDRLRQEVEVVPDRKALEKIPVPSWESYLQGS